MSSLRGIGTGGPDGVGGSAAEPGLVIEARRLGVRRSCLGAGTLACPRCDLPVSPGERALSPASPLSCPYCLHHAPVRDFLSLGAPSRPARVLVRVAWRDTGATDCAVRSATARD